ncbi:uncharacterized protein LOC107039252 [Diachasma alloeum]|uniref:uncharacterized protein LOC107039252 n=1 Tax=Diachasma alloeum TaxID=454923 RepID=UPI00073816A3|nr:uncharacterized protein LOC107039252 [Diachasma alloeum]
MEPLKTRSLVFFDLETNGLDIPTAEIIQVAAKCGENTLNKHIIPANSIPAEVTAITGLSVIDGVMYDRSRNAVETVTKEKAMTSFIEFLSSLGGKALLIAHNAHNFDAPIISRTMHEVGLLHDFITVVLGFSDTLPMFRYDLPERPYRCKNYKLPALAQDLLGFRDPLHDAMADIEVLERLTQHERVNADVKKFMTYGRSIQSILNNL